MLNKIESLQRSLNPDFRTKELREKKRSKRRMIIEISIVVALVSIGLIAGCVPRDKNSQADPAPNGPITVSEYMAAYKNEVGPIMYEEIGDPASEGMAKDLPGLTKIGYVTAENGAVSLMLLQFDSADNAGFAKIKYGTEVQATVRDNLMLVLDTSTADEAATYLRILDHVR